MRNNKGSIFVFTLWVIFILATFSVYIAYNAYTRIKFIKRIEARQKLRLAAESAVYRVMGIIKAEDAIEPKLVFSRVVKDIQKRDDTENLKGYNYNIDINDCSVRCGVYDEERALNVNRCEFDPLKYIVMAEAGLEEKKAEITAGSIIDWRDDDNERRNQRQEIMNSEDMYYKLAKMPYTPKNRRYDNIYELTLVKDVTPEVYENIRPYVTVYGNGKININTCSLAALRSIGINPKLAENIMLLRTIKGKGVCLFPDESAVISILDEAFKITENEKIIILNLLNTKQLGVESNNYRIEAIAEAGKSKMSVQCVMTQSGCILYWNEMFFSV